LQLFSGIVQRLEYEPTRSNLAAERTQACSHIQAYRTQGSSRVGDTCKADTLFVKGLSAWPSILSGSVPHTTPNI